MEFRAEQAFLNAQLSRFDPLSTALRKRSVGHFLNAGLLLFLEVVLYGVAIACIALFFFKEQLYPLYLLTRFSRPEYVQLIGKGNLANLNLLVWGLVAIIAILSICWARSLRSLRHKNIALVRTGTVVKGFMGDLLQRKAALDALEQRHYATLPMVGTQSSVGGVNEVVNPGYDPAG